MTQYALNKATFLIPTVPDKFADLNDARKTINQLQQCIGDIVRSLQVVVDTGTGGGTPGGPDGAIQFNNAGVLDGMSGVTIDKITGMITAADLNVTG
jgi:hypothetical protein